MEEQAIEKANLISKGKWIKPDYLNEWVGRPRTIEKISSEFKVAVSNLRDFFEQTKQHLDAEELKIGFAESGQAAVEKTEWVNIAEKSATGYINKAVSKMSQIVAELTPAEHTVHRNYFQRYLHSYLLLSPFVRRAYLKPLGYPGDYEMMNMLYGNHDQGETLFARLINRYSCRVTAAQSVIGRVPYMLMKLNDAIDRTLREKEVVSIMSVGSGPAREIVELIEKNQASDCCRMTLVDTDTEALQHASQVIRELKKTTQNHVQISYLNKSIQQLILDPLTLDSFRSQDLIYALGLFDYLPPRSAMRVVQNLYQLLSEGGELIVGNFGPANDSRFYMEYGLEWYLLYRDPKEMIRLAETIPLSSRVCIDTDEKGVQLYLIIEKKKRSDYQRIDHRNRTALYGQI
jgi:extracellular factor (EF) 3-hydroxypalmitic acid methyl ester biosynthesis protein